MVIEGTLALTGQWTITDYWEKTGKMQGFLEGFKNVARDEHRHVAYGTWYLKEAAGRGARRANPCLARTSTFRWRAWSWCRPGQDPTTGSCSATRPSR